MDRSISDRVRAGYGGGQLVAVTVVATVGLVVLPVLAGAALAIRLLDRQRRKGTRCA